jgi:hypothetical protein
VNELVDQSNSVAQIRVGVGLWLTIGAGIADAVAGYIGWDNS